MVAFSFLTRLSKNEAIQSAEVGSNVRQDPDVPAQVEYKWNKEFLTEYLATFADKLPSDLETQDGSVFAGGLRTLRSGGFGVVFPRVWAEPAVRPR